MSAGDLAAKRLRERIEALSPEKRALLEAKLRQAGLALPAPPIARRAPGDALPLSFGQQRLWFLDQLEPGGAGYVIPAPVRLRGRVDAPALERALGEVVRRHEILRTTYAAVDGRPVQVIAPAAPLAIEQVDLGALPPEAREAEVRSLAAADARRPFDLSLSPVLRATLVRLADDDHVLLLAMHHIAADGWSAGILVSELSALYTAFLVGAPSPLPELPVQYADFARWQRAWLQGERLERELAYWKEKLAGAPALLELPTDRPRPSAPTHRAGSCPVTLPAEAVEALKRLAHAENATLFMALTAAFQALLARYAGVEDVCVGTPIANRTRAETEGLVGFFVNTLVLRTDLSGEPSFRALLRRARDTALGAYAHQDVPFELLVERLAPERSLAHSPLFQAMIVLQNAPAKARRDPAGVTWSALEASSETAKFDLTLTLAEEAGGVAGTLEYGQDLFDAPTIARMVEHLRLLVERAAADPDRPFAELPLLSEAERRRLLVEWNATACDFPADQCIHEVFEEQAARTPTALAVVGDERSIGYGELDARSNRLARHLRALGVRRGTLVGLLAARVPDTVVALLAILKAGGAYVPLDPDYPVDRIAVYVEDASIAVLLAAGPLPAQWTFADVEIVRLDDPDRMRRIAGEPAAPLAEPIGSDALAYVIFTSGSTGRPKGVMIDHRGAMNLWEGLRRTVYAGRDGQHLRVTLNASLAFDASVQQVLALLGGHALHLVPQETRLDGAALTDFVRRHRIDVVDCVPTQLKLMLQAGLLDGDGWRPSVLLPGGEAIDARTWEALASRPDVASFNMYGPTECTVDATTCRIEPCSGRPHIGRPMANRRAYVLDAHLAPVPVGVPGELYLGGEGVGRGYVGRPELTAERFVPDPFGERAGRRLYRTGDRARWLPTGDLEYLGRLDGQVKLRGFRIETGEIEAALLAQAGVKESVVMVREDGGSARLVAYVIPSDPLHPLPAQELRDALRRTLPGHMVPSAVVVLPTWPLTPNGKIDRKALPSADEARSAPAGEGPRTPTEELVAAAFREVLALERVGRDESFFDLGGHSLLATQIVSRLRKALSVELPVRSIFTEPTVRGLAALAERALVGERGTLAPPLRPTPRQGPPPLSFAQQRLWFFDQLEPGSTQYVIPGAARLEGRLDAEALGRALAEVVRRHEVLRTTFRSAEGKPVQVIAAEAALPLARVDLGHLPPAEREARVRAMADEEARRPFDLAAGPLLRARLLRLADDDHVLLVAMHHVISDGWSIGVLLGELATLYQAFAEGRPSPLPPLDVQYADFARWQRAWLDGATLEAEIAWWKERLAGAPPVLELPTDRPRPAVQTSNGGHRAFRVDAEVAAALRKVSREEGATLFMTLLAAFQVVLGRYAGQDDVCVGTPIANRTRAEIEGLIGFFVNTLVLRTDLSGDPTFRGLVGRVRDAALAAYGHQDVPFEKIVDAVVAQRSLSHTPLFQVMFDLQREPRRVWKVPGLAWRALDIEANNALFDLTLTMTDADGLGGDLEYNTDLFDEETAARMIGHLQTLLQAAARAPDRPISALPLLDDGERRRVLVEWNATAAEYPRDACAHHLFERQADRTPDAVALVHEGTQLTYGALEARANRLARRLRALGVGPGERVGILLDRSPDLAVALLAAMKAGGAYVPFDPADPGARLSFLLEDSGARVVLTHARHATRVPAGARTVLELDAERGAIEREEARRLADGATPEAPAYVIYTSGSTGTPKGVLVPHRAVVNHNVAFQRLFELGADDRVLQFANVTFDQSVEEIFPTWASGARLVLRPGRTAPTFAELHALVERERLTLLHLPTAYWHAWVAELDATGSSPPPPLRLVNVGGEKASAAALSTWLRRARGCGWVNTYGPTEAAVSVTAWSPRTGSPVPAEVPIGRPIANARTYVLDGAGQPAPVGVPGELHLGGDCVALGYLNRPELTAERFVEDPFAGRPGARMYRTGDRARWRPDGELEYLGRADDQAKIRGFRVEMGEIEALLTRQRAVADAVALVREDGGARRIVAYVTGREAQARPDPGALEAALRERLPDHMVPSAIVVLDALPLTSHGKVDRRALPAPEIAAAGQERYVAPRTPAEEALAGIWQALLRVPRVGVHDNFFQLGGDSILSIQVIARAQQAGLHLTPRQIFEQPTVAGLAAVAGTRASSAAEQGVVEGSAPLTPIQRWFFEQELPEPHHYNQSILLEVETPPERERLEAALRALLRHHDALRLRYDRGADGSWSQRHAAPDDATEVLRWEDVSAVPEAERPAALERLAADVQGSLDLARGPLFRAAYFEGARPGAGRLLLAAHHLVVDGVSWRILLEDLATAYGQLGGGGAVQLPSKTTAFRDWARALERAAASPEATAERAFWTAWTGEGAPRLPLDFPGGENTEGSAAVVEARLTVEETRALLQDVPRAYHTEINDVLLAALARALGRWTGHGAVSVLLEGHGREEIGEPVDVSRTVGWFTTEYPVRLELPAGADPGALLTAVKEQLRRIPRRGIGYGLLRYLGGEAGAALAARSGPDVSFNHLGQLDGAGAGGPFRPSAAPRGPERSARGRRGCAVDVTSAIAEGRLGVEWTYSGALHRRETIELACGWFVQALRAMVEHCRAPEAGGYSPSDFALANVSQRTLDRVLAKSRKRSGGR